MGERCCRDLTTWSKDCGINKNLAYLVQTFLGKTVIDRKNVVDLVR